MQVSPSPLHTLELDGTSLSSITMNWKITPLEPVLRADLKGNNNLETISILDGILSILSNNQVIWQSPRSWDVVQSAISDLDHDGQFEITLLLWRPFRPWPVDLWQPNGGRINQFHNSHGKSCHIILIGWKNGKFHEVWAGSAMVDPVTSFAIGDLDGDQIQEMITLEGSYSDKPLSPAHKLKVWKWNGFGFSIVSSLAGTFSKMKLVQAMNGQTLIVVP